jgi:hypothetical protein
MQFRSFTSLKRNLQHESFVWPMLGGKGESWVRKFSSSFPRQGIVPAEAASLGLPAQEPYAVLIEQAPTLRRGFDAYPAHWNCNVPLHGY